MDARYWKEFESMGDMDADKRSDSDDLSPRYSKDSKKGDMKARRKRSRTKSRSRSHSSSSSSSGSSTRSSSSSSRRHSDDRSYRSRKRESHYVRKSPSRGTVRSSSYGSGREEGGSGWFPPAHPSTYPNQGQEVPPSSSSYIPPGYSQAPPSAQGQYPPNYQGPNFGSNYHPGYTGYDSGPAPGNYYAPNFPHGSQPPPPPHEYGMSGGPSSLGPSHPPSNWEMFPDTTLPPPNLMQGPVSGDTIASIGPDMKTEEAKKEAIEQELLQQKRTLAKQREDYVRRKFSLSRELNRLKDQKRELIKEKSKENERILRENAKLQSEIQQKLKSIDNVIEMLTNIIGDSARLPEVIKEIKNMEKSSEKPKKSEKKKHPPTEERVERRSSESGGKDGSPPHHSREENRVYYDPGLHWCPDCNVFPKTVTHYLEHLHTSEHRQHSKLKFEDFPWHAGQNLHEKSPQFSKDSPPKRIPIRGVQFLIPASAWFCSMCKVWLGDDHCASKHVQSNQHAQNYNDFIMRNPHWEVDWLTERTRSYERNSEAKQQQQQHSNQQHKQDISVASATPSVSAPATIASLSDQLLAMLAANSKTQPQEPPPPPPPPPLIKSSSSSGEEDSPDRKSKKKKKKAKKRKRSKERKSPSKEKIVHPSDQIKLSYKSMPERKVDPIPVDDNFISEWMPRVEKREAVHLKKKSREEGEGKMLSKRQRKASEGSREPSSEGEKKTSPYDQMYNDHDEAVVFEKQRPSYDKEASRSKKRMDEELKHDRHSRYERESSREKSKIDERYKYKSDKYRYEKDERDFNKYDDYKFKKDFKTHKDFNERERIKKSPLPRIKDSIEKKKLKAKTERNSDEDAHETSFEKRTSESALKKKDGKKLVLNNLPKTKLPFIGRMPILKKKVEQKSEEKDDKKETIEEDGVKDSAAEPILSETAMTGDVNIPNIESSLEELPKSTLIISKRPRLAEPGIVKKEILFNKPANDNLTEQDMELDDDSGIPKEEEPAKDELHKDFKDALDLLFPEEKKKEEGDGNEIKPENEVKLEDQQQAAAAVAAAAGYMLPPGYDVSMYPSYYDQQAYVQQQWAQMGYDQAAQYPGAYAYPPPMDQTPMGVVQQPPPASTDIQPPEVKKKKNAPSQRMRRHLKKLKAKEAAQKGSDSKEDEETNEGDEEVLDDDEVIDDENPENGDGQEELNTSKEPKTSAMSISDLAMLGIDEDDAAAQGFF